MVDPRALPVYDPYKGSIAIPKYHFTDEYARKAKLFIKNLRTGDAIGSLEQAILTQSASLLKPLLNRLSSNGYIDFLLLQAETPMQEKMNLLRLAGDQYIVHFTGREPPVFSYGGVLVNALNANHLNHFIAAYNYFMRASKASSVSAEVVLRYDDFRVKGQMTSLTAGIRGENQLSGSFSFQILVRGVELRVDTGDGNTVSGEVVRGEADITTAGDNGEVVAYAVDDVSNIG